ncbi:MAG: hypothetical protein COW30_12535 [Rhodospirillales bacterium CG15_BIG_FIL_POST_REV_8_21_14_020_66_15]|nr:MAG: hypothetical protein COW30_12535 [Rhodospirillales bacterium CG15_BIG_FIL_POST_REV_8_21_14_020_66_15]
MKPLRAFCVVIAAGLVAGCSHLIENMERSMKANADAIEICLSQNLSVDALDSIRTLSISNYIGRALRIPLEPTIGRTAKYFPQHLLEVERRFHLLKASLRKLTWETELPAVKKIKESWDAHSRIVEDDVSGIKLKAEAVVGKVRSISDGRLAVYSDFAKYGPIVLTAVARIQGDVYGMRSDVEKLLDDVRRAQDELFVLFQELRTDIGNTDEPAEAFKELRRAIAGMIDSVKGVITAVDIVRERGFDALLDSEELKTQRDDFITGVKTYIYLKAAKVAVNRLEQELFVIEGKLNQIDEKAWFAISVATLFLEGVFAGDNDEELNSAIDRVMKPDVYGSLFQKEVRSADALVKVGANEYKLSDFWRVPLATVACERVLRSVELTDLARSRTDQLLNPVYLRFIKNHKEWVDAQKERAKEEKLKRPSLALIMAPLPTAATIPDFLGALRAPLQ